MQLGAPGQSLDFSFIPQPLWIPRALDRTRVRQKTSPRYQGDRTKHEEVFPGKVGEEHGLARLAPVSDCLYRATDGFARQGRL